jgi:spoIIIJ-associated protein
MPTAPPDGPTEVSITVADSAELSEIGEICRSHLVRMLTEMGFGMEGTVTEHPGSVHFALTSEAYGDVMTARGFQVLQALEHLLDKLVNTGEDDRKKVRLDINGHRDKQDDELGAQAIEMAKRAMEEGKVYKMGPLNPRARRLIHIALREVDGVSTESEGEGVFRRVCIVPDEG